MKTAPGSSGISGEPGLIVQRSMVELRVTFFRSGMLLGRQDHNRREGGGATEFVEQQPVICTFTCTFISPVYLYMESYIILYYNKTIAFYFGAFLSSNNKLFSDQRKHQIDTNR